MPPCRGAPRSVTEAGGKDSRGRGGESGVTTSPVGTTTAPVEVHTVVVGGMPGWQIALIAVMAALVAATVAVLADRARTARRKVIAATA